MADFDPATSLGDVQGLILRGYGMPRVRYLLLRVADPAAARAFLAGLVSGNPAASPQLTTATPWAEKPDATLNVALTHSGLSALGLPAASLASFPAEFTEGAAARAARLDDTGESAPDQWVEGLRPEDDPHLLLIIFAKDDGACNQMSGRLRALFSGACTELPFRDGGALPDGHVHFGFRDGISQPVIEGAPERQLADRQPPAPTGEFLLGYPSQFVDFSYPVPQPDALGQNGSFAVFRIGKQEVHLFETFLEESAAKHGVSKEWVAAKLCGRWRNGLPLSLSPDTDTPATPIAREALNDFDYVKSNTFPADPRGLRCPVGAHIRRNNPRGSFIAGGDDSHKHRLVRRGLPYGPPYDPDHPDDGEERGLLGMFICVSIRDQFEFLITQWINEGTFAPGISGTKDPILGSNRPEESRFVIPTANGPIVLTGFPRFVITRGCAYCFLPSVTALKFLSTLS